MTHAVLYDCDGRIEADLPLDREPHERLVTAVLAWTESGNLLQPYDCEKIALQLTGHANLVAADIRLRAITLPAGSLQRALVEAILGEADWRLSVPLQDSVRCCQNRARLVRALYERLDVLSRHVGDTRAGCLNEVRAFWLGGDCDIYR
ncbi:hypothetical protein ACIRPT_40365, partial [Streptomyces sp. NPDC101227]|uniref:hypothetical protein n=1 Tax=Streptomyces sp. NPDC101227 TaxID=3366136 RepID=UPI0037FD3846